MLELDLLLKLIESHTETEWLNLLFQLARGLGFDSVVFAVVASKYEPLESAFVRSNYSKMWCDHYNANQLYYIDPTVKHCMTSVLPIVWSPQIFDAPNQRKLYEDASSFGLRSGISFPIHASGGKTGMISFSALNVSVEQFSRQLPHHLADLSLLRDYAFQSSLKYLGGHEVEEPAPHLTARELEVLKWIVAGKSVHETARVMNCAEATISFHIVTICQKFKVMTCQSAVVKAIALGVIALEALGP